jgi:hypothetical protein
MISVLLQNNAIAQIKETEPSGVYLWIGIGVFVVLFVYLLFHTDKILQKEKQAEMPSAEQKPIHEFTQHDVHEEEAAAIAMALYLYKRDLHDKESFTITMQKVSRIYSPWSSKIYTLRQIPNRR